MKHKNIWWIIMLLSMLALAESCQLASNKLNYEDNFCPETDKIPSHFGYLDSMSGEYHGDEPKTYRLEYDSVFSNLTQPSKDNFVLTTSLALDSIEIQIRTRFLTDSLSFSEEHWFYPIPLRQEILFYSNKFLKKKIRFPAKNVRQHLASGRTVMMQENRIGKVAIVQGKRCRVLAVSGWGGCNSCSEYLGIFSLEGENLGESYLTKFEEYIFSASCEEMIDQCGLLYDQLEFRSCSHVCIDYLLEKFALTVVG